MTKVLFVNMPSHGHVNPTFPLVSAFVEAGHTVDYLLTEEFRKKVEYSGATLIPYKSSYSVDINHKSSTIKMIREVIQIIYNNTKAMASKYDVIIAGGINPLITKIEQEISIPVVYCSATFLYNEQSLKYFFEKTWDAPAIIRFVATHPKWRKWLARQIISRIFGVPIDDLLALFRPQSSTLNIVFTSRCFQPEEATFDERCLFIGPTPTVTPNDDTFPIKQLETCKKPIIYVTLGTVFNKWTDFFKNVIQAFRDSEYLVVMSTGNKETVELLGHIPDNFIVRDFVPQAEVLKYADLFIAHGGMGSVSDGISLGVPMLLVPQGADQFFNAYRLQELGAGKVMTKKEATAENLKREAILILTIKTYQSEAKRIQESFIAAGGPSHAVEEVERLLAKIGRNREADKKYYQCHCRRFKPSGNVGKIR